MQNASRCIGGLPPTPGLVRARLRRLCAISKVGFQTLSQGIRLHLHLWILLHWLQRGIRLHLHLWLLMRWLQKGVRLHLHHWILMHRLQRPQSLGALTAALATVVCSRLLWSIWLAFVGTVCFGQALWALMSATAVSGAIASAVFLSVLACLE